MKLQILSILLAALSLQAAEPPAKIPASFYAFDYVPGHESVFVRSGEAAYDEIRLSKANIIGPISTVFMQGQLLINSKPETGADGKTTYPVLATAKLPAGLKRALVVLFPNAADSPPGYRTLVVDHDSTTFALGSYRMINLAPYPVRGAVAEVQVEAKPGGIANLTPKGEPGDIVPVRFEYFDNDRWNGLTETRAAIRKDRRWLMFVYKDPDSGRMNIRTIPDRTPSPEELGKKP